MKNTPRSLSALALLIGVLLASCGLPTVTYLFPPLSMTVDNSAVMVQNDISNYEPSEGSNQTFKGIELFYRVYQDQTAASAALTTLGNLADTYSSDPESFIATATNDTYRYLRLRSTATKSAPLLPLDAGDDGNYYLYLNPATDWTLAGSTIIRNLDTSASDTSFYVKDFNAGDDDFAGSTINPGDPVYIVFFSVSFGVDQATVGQTVYSVPNIPSSYAQY